MHSVRLRITLIAAITTAIAVALSGFLLIGRLDASLAQEIDDSLERQVLNYTSQMFVTDDLGTQPVPNDIETLLVVIDTDGWVHLANDLGVDGVEVARQLVFDPVLNEDVEFADLSLESPTETSSSTNLRAAYYEFFLDDQGEERYIAVIARSDGSAERTVAAVRRALFVGVPLLVAFVAALAWWLTSRSLRPVDQLRREVDDIRSTDLTQRVSQPRSTDEIGQLATTMNGMLGRLEQAQRSQNQFVSDAAHELRTPLASMAAQIDVDAAHPGSADPAATAANIRAEVSRLQALIDGLLASARNQNGAESAPRALLDLDVIASEAAARVARPAALALDQSAVGIGTVRGEQTALASLVDNLLANAYRHAQGKVAIGVGTDEAGVWLTVDDDGSGIAEADRERVFDRFLRLDEARTKESGGSGLGLALARETATRHGGTLHVESSALGGARFALRLPAAS